MASNIFQRGHSKIENKNHAIEVSLIIAKIRNGIWIFGIPSWLFGITDRNVASMADGYLSTLELFQLFTASCFFLGWLYLKPEENLDSTDVDINPSNLPYLSPQQEEIYLRPAQARMVELQEQHLIRQEYILPFSYLCQIYHLLNLKHLETIHNFSLNNLKVIKVSDCQPTAIGGTIKFQTILDSPANPLRIWRQPIVEVGLVLHSPYTVELCIPAYNNKHIIVVFNVIPITQTKHKFVIDIYSDLEWPKPLLRILLHFAACLTLFEDLPYLRKLAQRNVERLVNLSRISNHETMWLFKRFVDLYGANIQPSKPMRSIEQEIEHQVVGSTGTQNAIASGT